MIRTIVVEGESFQSEEIRMFLDATEQISIEKTYSDPFTALSEAKTMLPQVVFTDTVMSSMDGVTFAERYLEKNPLTNIVFISERRQDAVRAFEIHALDYLVKPLNSHRFSATKRRIKHKVYNMGNPNNCNLSIKCFNQLNVYVNGRPIKWQRVKAEELFAFLLMNLGKFISKELIIENLWPGYEKKSALSILQTTACYVRNVLSIVENWGSLDYKAGSYQLKLNHAECDLFEFEKALREIEDGRNDNYSAVERVCLLYGKGFISQNGYVWSIEKDQELLNRLVALLKNINEKFTHFERDAERIKILKLLSTIVPYEEEINNLLLNALKSLERFDELKNHYLWLEKVLREEYDTVPEKSTIRIVRSI